MTKYHKISQKGFSKDSEELLHDYIVGGKGCSLKVVKPQQRVQQEGGEDLKFDHVSLEQATISNLVTF